MPQFIDFEASALDTEESFPIEVGFCNEEGQGASWLIKPDSEWFLWNSESEKIHNITRSELNKHGLEPIMVASMLNSSLKNETVYCDGHRYDQHWLDRLFEAAQMTPSFRLGNYGAFIQESILRLPVSPNKKKKKWEAFLGEYRSNKEKIAHRALADTQRLARLYKTHC